MSSARWIDDATRNARAIAEELLSSAAITLNGDDPSDIQVLDERLFQRVLAEGSLGLGEAYMDGWWEAASLDGFFDKLLGAQLEDQVNPMHMVWAVAKAKVLNMQDRQRCRRVVEDHYDLDNALYERMLDRHMQYTCAYWHGASDLDAAQTLKLEQICQKLNLQPGERVLELGCGFGGLARYAAERFGVHVTGYNISREQLAWGRRRCEGLDVELLEADYRDAHGVFDKVVSVGLCEHVGYKNHRTLMQVAHRCLKPGGLFLLHCIGQNRTRVTTDPWLEKYIFPGSVLPSAKQLSEAFEDLFVLEDWHNFGVDYDHTLMAWWENFDRHWPELQATGRYNTRFYRMWKYYLLMCAGSFRARKNQNWELLLARGGVRGGVRTPRL